MVILTILAIGERRVSVRPWALECGERPNSTPIPHIIFLILIVVLFCFLTYYRRRNLLFVTVREVSCLVVWVFSDLVVWLSGGLVVWLAGGLVV